MALTRVERPAVEVSGELADVRSSARDRLAAGGPGGEGGGPNWMLIAGGLLVVVLVGAGWAVARRAA